MFIRYGIEQASIGGRGQNVLDPSGVGKIKFNKSCSG